MTDPRERSPINTNAIAPDLKGPGVSDFARHTDCASVGIIDEFNYQFDRPIGVE
jgi:hypothetical protein